MKTLSIWLLAAVIMALLVVHETGMFEEHFGPSDPPGMRLLAAPEVAGEMVPVRTLELETWHWASGRLEASHVVQVFPEVAGRLLELNAELGTRVKSGDVLARIDDAAAQLAVAKVGAQIALAESRIAAAEAAVGAADTAILAAEVQREHADTEAARQLELKEKAATTDQALQAALTAQKAALAQVASARAGKAQAESEVQSANEAVKLAKVQKQDAERILSKTTVIASIDGVVQARLTEAGSVVSPGAPLLTLRPLGQLEAVAWFSEETLPKLGDSLLVRIGDADVGSGEVTELGTTVDPFTRTRAVHVDLGAKGLDLSQLPTGGFCELGRTLGTRSVMLIPSTALRRQGQVQSVTIATDRGPVEQHVRTTSLTRAEAAGLDVPDGRWLEVLSGLTKSDRVEVRK